MQMKTKPLTQASTAGNHPSLIRGVEQQTILREAGMLEGIADLPLHEGRVPPWMLRLMQRMAAAIVEVLIEEYGPRGFVERMASPHWFQALNNVIGMDWDSSGSTTVTLGVLKTEAWRRDWGILILGGKGSRARRVPQEIPVAARRLGLGEDQAALLERVSRLAAKVDSAMLQDRYQLYHHALMVSKEGAWSIVQQGMNPEARMARRYHWLYRARSLVVEPHSSVAGYRHSEVLNMSASESEEARKTVLDLAKEKPATIASTLASIERELRGLASLERWIQPSGKTPRARGVPEIYRPLPDHRSVARVVGRIREINPGSMEELLLVRGVGPSTLRALALIADLVYNAAPSTRDPVNASLDPFTYAYAVGGKDGAPYPYDRRTAEEVIVTLEDAVERAKLGDKEKLRALKRLARLVRLTTRGGT